MFHQIERGEGKKKRLVPSIGDEIIRFVSKSCCEEGVLIGREGKIKGTISNEF